MFLTWLLEIYAPDWFLFLLFHIELDQFCIQFLEVFGFGHWEFAFDEQLS